MDNLENENIEIALLLEAIQMKYGYDFREYARASIKRRVKHCMELSGLESISDIQRKILYDRKFFSLLLQGLTINVTEMFRDPEFYKALRQIVIPELSRLPYIKIWHAGCATGEEAYSMAILLKEAGIYSKSRIYATDFDEAAISKAKEGVYPVDKLKTYIRNYMEAGGENSFADYYTARYEFVLLDKALKENIVFFNHNLVTDGVFGEVDMVVCRNVLIYFKKELQERVFRLFMDSLHAHGFLCLGSEETIRMSESSVMFENTVPAEKIYRKK